MVEGNSIRATVRMTGVAKNTVSSSWSTWGRPAASTGHDDARPALRRIQVDEIWSFVLSKQKNVPESKRGEYGDVWTWIAIDADTKLVPSFLVGRRDAEDAQRFMTDLAGRLANRVQLTTDGHKAYLTAVEGVRVTSTTGSWSRFTARTRPRRSASRYSPAPASARTHRRSRATPTRRTSPPATSSART